MKNSIIFVILTSFLSFSISSFAKEPKCSIRKWTEDYKNAISVPVTLRFGREIIESKTIIFDGVKASASFNKGDDFERQTCFQMQLDDTTATLYDVFENSKLPSLDKGGKIIFQCWFE